MFYLTTHSTHFIYGYMASDIWLRTILIVRKETRCRHIGYSYRLTARVLLYAPSQRQDNTYHNLCYTSRGALAGTRNYLREPNGKCVSWSQACNVWCSWCNGSSDRSLMVDPLSSTTGVIKAVVCAILSVGGCIYKNLCCWLERVTHVVAATGFISRYLNGPLPYVRCHINVLKMC